MILVLCNIILITNFKLIEMCIKSSPMGEGKGEGPLAYVLFFSIRRVQLHHPSRV